MVHHRQGVAATGALHLDDKQMQLLMDQELTPALKELAIDHLEACPGCRAKWRALEEVCLAVRATKPTEQLFSAGGEFWARVALHLPRQRPSTWPLAAYLPPVVLAVFGVFIEFLLSLAFALYALSFTGVVPVLAMPLGEWLPSLLVDPVIEGSLNIMGWSARGSIEGLLRPWEGIVGASQNGLLFGAALLILGCVLAAVVIMDFLWLLCWSEANQLETRGGL